MPTNAVLAQRHEDHNVNNTLIEEESLAQLQQAVQQNEHRHDIANNANDSGGSSGSNGNNGEMRNGSSTPATYTDGARIPFVAGADYSSLRLLTRRQPRDPESVLQGLDISNMDLSWTAREGPSTLDPNGEPWRYPKKRGKGEGSNLDQFKDEITERTKNGEGCKAIAEVFIARGVDTSARAVARQRMKWGLRQRAPRKMTEQGIANIRKAHLEQAKRMANSDPVPVKRVRIRVMRKAEITRMTKEGMSAAQIADNLVARGVKLTRGAATVERLRTVWGLTEDTRRSVNSIRAASRNQAMKAQQDQFTSIAEELGVENVDAWVKSKMDEESAQDARRDYAYRLMGDARPKSDNPDQLRRNTSHSGSLREQRMVMGNVLTNMPSGVSTPVDGSLQATSGPSAPAEVLELSDDEDDMEDDDLDGETGEAGKASDDYQAALPSSTRALQPAHAGLDVERPTPMPPEPAQGATGAHVLDTRPEPVRPPVTEDTGGPNVRDIIFFTPHRSGGSHNQTNVTIAPPAGMPGRRPTSFANIVPRPTHAAPRAIVPRPIAPQLPPFHPQKPEIDYMAQFGLFPYPCSGKPPQKYLTPNGVISTDGYEYLASPPHPTGNETVVYQLPPNIVRLPPPPPADYIVVPSNPHSSPPESSQMPQPALRMTPEEVEKHSVEAKLLAKYHQTSQECLDIVSARATGRPMPKSLTGLPPSLQDIQLAKEKLRKAATALLVEL